MRELGSCSQTTQEKNALTYQNTRCARRHRPGVRRSNSVAQWAAFSRAQAAGVRGARERRAQRAECLLCVCVCKSCGQRPFLSAGLALNLLLVPPRRDGVQEGTGRRGAAGGRALHSKACRSSRFCSQDSSLLRALQEVRAQPIVTGDTDVFDSRAGPRVSPSVSLPSDCPVFGAVQGPRAWVQASETQAAEGGTVGLCPCTSSLKQPWR